MSTRAVGILSIALVTFGRAAAVAAPFTPYFDALRAELGVRAAALAGATDRSSKKQLKAVNTAGKAIDKASISIVKDLKTAGKIGKGLAKAFPDEFIADDGLALLIDRLLDDLAGDVSGALDAAGDAVAAPPDGACKLRATDALGTAMAGVVAAGNETAPSMIAGALRQALKQIARAEKIAAGCSGGGGGGGDCPATNAIAATVDATPLQLTSAGYFRGADVRSLVVRGNESATTLNELDLVAHGVDGAGTFAVHASSGLVIAGDPTFTPPLGSTATGSITVSRFVYSNDGNPNDCFAGSFDVTFSNGALTKRVQGTFDVSQSFLF
jgi:hypothetical protein